MNSRNRMLRAVRRHTQRGFGAVRVPQRVVIGSLAVIMLLAGAGLAFSASSNAGSMRLSAALSPDTVGLGQGVPACFSSAPSVSCEANGTTDVSVSWTATTNTPRRVVVLDSSSNVLASYNIPNTFIAGSPGSETSSPTPDQYQTAAGSHTFYGLSLTSGQTYYVEEQTQDGTVVYDSTKSNSSYPPFVVASTRVVRCR